jgi:hypothetical protein
LNTLSSSLVQTFFLFTDYFLEDIVQMLDFTPPPSDKKRRGGRDDDDGAPPNEGDEDTDYKEVRSP